MIIKDRRISPKLAKLAKEKGFKNGVVGIIVYHEDKVHPEDGTNGPFGGKKGEIDHCDFMINVQFLTSIFI